MRTRPQLYLLATRRTWVGRAPASGPTRSRPVTSAVPWRRCCSVTSAQLLLNGPPVLVPALAQNELEVTRAGQFLAAFTLARVPLFLVVPLQTALLPMLTGVLHAGTDGAAPVLVRLFAGLAVLGAWRWHWAIWSARCWSA